MAPWVIVVPYTTAAHNSGVVLRADFTVSSATFVNGSLRLL